MVDSLRQRLRGVPARSSIPVMPEALRELMALCRRGRVTLVFAARDRERNQAMVLREVLLEELAVVLPAPLAPAIPTPSR